MYSRIISGFLATFVANGLARFGYVVLIPFMILSGTLTTGQSYALAIAILIGYIFGDIWLRYLRRYLCFERCISINLLIIGISFLACMIHSLPFAFAFFWRFLAGMSSASLMIMAAPLCLPLISPRHKGKVAGFIFSGIGLGAVASGFSLPWLAGININLAWLCLALIALLSTAYTFFSLKSALSKSSPTNPPAAHNTATTFKSEPENAQLPAFSLSSGMILLIISYALNAIGYLGHTLFWVDYLVRYLHFSSFIAGISWAFFGIGAAFGSLVSGWLADKLGVKQSHIFILLLKTCSALIAAFSMNLALLNVSVFLMGFTTTGNVALTNTMALYSAGEKWFTRASGVLTFYFGLIQAIFSFIFSFWMKNTESYLWLFLCCAVALFFSALLLLPIKLPARS